ncbi:Crp/Fnr family transcriptional regulator [Fibrobacterota bacterium]
MAKNYRKIERTYNTDEVIFSENSESDGMYIINSGQVSVFKTLQEGGESKEMELARIGPMGMFGEMAVIDEHMRSASVKALEPTKVTVITKEMFDDQLAKLPSWVVTMIKLLVGRIRLTNDKLRKMINEQKQVSMGGGDSEDLIKVGEEIKEQEPQEDAARDQSDGSAEKEPEAESESQAGEEEADSKTRQQTEQLLQELDF